MGGRITQVTEGGAWGVASHRWLKGGGHGGSVTQVAEGGPWGVASHRWLKGGPWG